MKPVLTRIPIGATGASNFEQWCLTAIKIIGAGSLGDIQLHPNKEAIQRRDILGAVQADTGFWKRLQNDYSARQVVFEIKNKESLGPSGELRQLSSYLNGPYGNIGFIITRSQEENLASKDLDWVREIWYSQKKLCIILPVKIVMRLLRKCRSPQGRDYCNEQLSKLLNTYERFHLSLKHTNSESGQQRKRSKRRRKKRN